MLSLWYYKIMKYIYHHDESHDIVIGSLRSWVLEHLSIYVLVYVNYVDILPISNSDIFSRYKNLKIGTNFPKKQTISWYLRLSKLFFSKHFLKILQTSFYIFIWTKLCNKEQLWLLNPEPFKESVKCTYRFPMFILSTLECALDWGALHHMTNWKCQKSV